MRAFLSDPYLAAMPPFGHTFPFGLYRHPGLAGIATDEARAVIGEAEPGPIELRRHVRAGETAYPYEDEAQRALAAALADFIGH